MKKGKSGLLILLASIFFLLNGTIAGHSEELCCCSSLAMLSMGVERLICEQNGTPDPLNCGYCTISWTGMTGTFECRADDDCNDYECWDYVLVEQKVYGKMECSHCNCDPPDRPSDGELYIRCDPDTCYNHSLVDCDCP